jgi:hypothetical protein
MQPTTCSNCNKPFANAFCSHCGQKETQRLTMPHLWHDLVHAFTHADRGFFYLLIQLFKKPGVVAREYILEGKRKRYFLPLQYLIIIGAIASFVVVNSHYIEEMMKNMSNFTNAGRGYSERQEKFMTTIALWQSRYYNFLLLLQLPFYAMSAYIVYKAKRYNFAELLTLQTFITAQTTVIFILLIGIVSITKSSPSYIPGIMLAISFSYTAWTYIQFFKDRLLKGILKALASHLLGMLFFILFFMLLVIIVGIFMEF